jgi:tRNA pseudouridine55 synthase
MPRRRKGRAVNGIFLLNKAVGFSSNQALQKVRFQYQAAKAGHTGALDPLATGMLPICLGEATKFSQFLLDADKVYEVTAKLGERTTTSDADGEIIETKPVRINNEKIEQARQCFLGNIKQIPSMYSALKYQGKPLYYYARKNIEIERTARPIEIFAIDILRSEQDEIDMRVHCSKGTYIRTLVDDMGQMLECGAHVSRLHRTEVSGFTQNTMMTFSQLEEVAQTDSNFAALDKLLLPMDHALSHLPLITLNNTQREPFCHGQAIKITQSNENTLAENSQLRIYENSDFLGIGTVQPDGWVAPKRLVNFEVKNNDQT